jgi:hypothetical protein
MDYSLRVPLNQDMEWRLKRYAEQRGKSYSEVIRGLISGLPLEKESFDYDLYRAMHERSIRKLDFWSSGEARRLVTEMMGCDTRDRLNGFFSRVRNKQAVAILSKLVPSNLTEMFFDPGLGRWSYGDWYDGLQLGEYVVTEEAVTDGFTWRGQESGLVTVNAYGAKVLNADNMMIVDVDTGGDDCHDQSLIASSDMALAALEFAVAKDETLGFRVYETANGLRYICTSKEAGDIKDGWRLMQSLYSDPLYILLCKSQRTYRARLSVKPWRGDHEENAVCRFVGVYGSDRVIEPFQPMIDYHDRLVFAGDQDELA